MEEKENVHVGHRERMVKKFLDNPNALLEHELLEMLLFYAVPRIDTNPLAHKILKHFGSIDKVFSATADQLKTIEGVGDKVASLIILFGKMSDLLSMRRDKKHKLYSFADVRKEIEGCFDSDDFETFVLLLLDKNRVKITSLKFSNQFIHQVMTDVNEISRAFVIHKPVYVILVHNHPSGKIEPSCADDLATMRVKLICDLHGVGLVDHVICAGDEYLSYHLSGRLDEIKNNADINKLLKTIKEKDYGKQES